MASVVSRAWRMVVRSGRGGDQPAGGQTGQTRPSPSGWSPWWGGSWFPGWGGSWSPWGGSWRRENPQDGAIEEFWEAPEKLQPLEGEGLGVGGVGLGVGGVGLRVGGVGLEVGGQGLGVGGQGLGVGGDPGGGKPGWWSWWSKFLPSWSKKTRPGFGGVAYIRDADGDFSDYGTPPPSPPPPPPLSPPTPSPFRLFLGGLAAPVLPEHEEICFNLLRHLFDLMAVGFLRAASRPARLVLELTGVRGALRLWLHGMAMFLVATAGVAGLLWAVQEHLPELALLYGLVQALVISVSLRRGAVATETEAETEAAQEPGAEEEPKDDPPGSVAGP